MSRTRTITTILAVALLTAVSLGARVTSQAPQRPAPAPADLVLRGGRIITLDDRTPNAQALAARNGAVVAIGSDADIARYVGPATQVVDLAGQTAIPGFIEGHGHFNGVGEGKLNLDLMNTKSWEEIVHQVALAVEKAKPG